MKRNAPAWFARTVRLVVVFALFHPGCAVGGERRVDGSVIEGPSLDGSSPDGALSSDGSVMRAPALDGEASFAADGSAGEVSPRDATLSGTLDAGPATMSRGDGCLVGRVDAEVALAATVEDMCAIWNSLGELDGDATVMRDEGSLSIDFGGGVIFEGTLSDDGSVTLTYVHEHDFSDGCRWQAYESLLGSLTDDCTLMLTYGYRESVLVDRGRCARPCSADARVELEITLLI